MTGPSLVASILDDGNEGGAHDAPPDSSAPLPSPQSGWIDDVARVEALFRMKGFNARAVVEVTISVCGDSANPEKRLLVWNADEPTQVGGAAYTRARDSDGRPALPHGILQVFAAEDEPSAEVARESTELACIADPVVRAACVANLQRLFLRAEQRACEEKVCTKKSVEGIGAFVRRHEAKP